MGLLRRDRRPFDVTFSVAARHRPASLLAPDQRAFGDTGAALGPGPERRTAEVTPADGGFVFDGSEPHFTLVATDAGDAGLSAPYCTVAARAGSFAGSTPQDAVFLGLAADADHYLVAWFSHASGQAGIDAVLDGELTTLQVGPARVEPGCWLSFSLTGPVVTASVDDGAGARPVAQATLPDSWRLHEPDRLAALRPAVGARATTGAVAVTRAVHGSFGQTGLRDPHVVTRADGSPYTRDGRIHLTMTNAGLGFFRTAHCGVWSLDPVDHSIVPEGRLFFRRDGGVYGDHACHLVHDAERGRWIVATSTWGDFDGTDVRIHHATLPLDTDLLSGTHVIDTEPLPLPTAQLPTGTVGQWDPHLVRTGDRWRVAFVNARAFFTFYPALASSDAGGDYTETTLTGADAAKVATEGVVIQRVGEDWFLLASNGDASPRRHRERYPVYDLGMHELGALDAPHPTNIPWPMVFPVDEAGAPWRMVTFDGTPFSDAELLDYGTHGDLLVLTGAPGARGPKVRR